MKATRSARLVPGLLLAALALVSASACGSDGADTEQPSRGASSTEVYVAVGASETVGVGSEQPLVEAWPRVLHGTLDLGTTFVSAGVSGSTVAEAIEDQLPIVRELQPTLVTVWLNVNDLVAGVSPAAYEEQLRELVRAIRQDGRARVLLANTPPVEELPAFVEGEFADLLPRELVAAQVEAYNGAISAVAASEGAEVVDLHAAALASIADGTFESLISEDGFHPSTAGHARVAELFAEAIDR